MTELQALLILNAIPGVGNATTRKVIDYYGSARKVLSLTANDLASDQIVSSKQAQAIASFPKDQFLAKELSLMAKYDVRALAWADAEYPAGLREIPDSPVVLYITGALPLDLSLSMAFVGSRKASLYGTSIAQQWAARFAEAGFSIISGMARGIDTAAHKGALQAKGKTVAVLGCGLAHVYPPENKKLSKAIAADGALVSEFAMQTLPLPFNFPRRNRIISGLSRGVIVVEAAAKSGALITADFALEQGREVYAIPGPVNSPNSSGVHNLIKQGAKLVSCIEDILEDVHPQLVREIKSSKDSAAPIEEKLGLLGEAEQKIFAAITDQPLHIDQIIERSGTEPWRISPVLSRLELKGFIKQLPGKLFVR